MIEIEVFGDTFLQHRRRERPERFALFDDRVDAILHGVGARITEDRACAQSAWSKLHASVEPTDNFPGSQTLCDCLEQFRFAAAEVLRLDTCRLDKRCNLIAAKPRSKVSMSQDA